MQRDSRDHGPYSVSLSPRRLSVGALHEAAFSERSRRASAFEPRRGESRCGSGALEETVAEFPP